MGQEFARVQARGYTDGLGGGTYIGLPPIINFGQPALREKVMKEVFAGKKFCALAITEAFAGSDVAGLKCLAKRVEGGWRLTGTCVIFHVFGEKRSLMIGLQQEVDHQCDFRRLLHCWCSD